MFALQTKTCYIKIKLLLIDKPIDFFGRAKILETLHTKTKLLIGGKSF